MDFLKEENGKYSITRAAFGVWIFGVFLIWAMGSFYHKILMPIDGSILTLIGIAYTGKVSQRFVEKEKPVEVPAPAPAPEVNSPSPVVTAPVVRPTPPVPPMPGV